MKKALIIVGIIVVAIIVFLAISANNSDKLECSGDEGSLTVYFNDTKVTGYKTSGYTFDMDIANSAIESSDLDTYISALKSIFESDYNGTCSIIKKN